MRRKPGLGGREADLGRTRKRLAVGAGVSVGAALGMSATAQAADFTVTNLSDGPGAGPAGSLRNALALAENGTGPDRVLFQSGLTGTITLTNGELFIDEPLEILGAGANVKVSGNNASRIFLIVTTPGAGDDVKISDLKLTSANPGSTVEGGAIKLDHADLTVENSTISNSSAKDGGAILATSHSDETTTIRNSTISGNHALAGFGGGIGSYYAPVTIEDTTMSGNTATGLGGAIYAGGFPLTSRNSTISGNAGSGGALDMFDGSMTIENSTIAGNTGNGIGGSYGTTINLTNSVVADNSSDDVSNGAYGAYASFSLVENPGTTTIFNSVPASNITGQDPQLAALGSNGGPTQTQRPAPTSPVVDQGKTAGGVTTDQRGLARPVDVPFLSDSAAAGADGADMGAVELNVAEAAPPPSAGISFLAAQMSDTPSYNRPDTSGAVGPSQILVAVNGRIKFFSKSGSQQFSTDDSSFWNSVRNGEQVLEPQVEYDRLSGRWIMAAINAPSAGPNRIMIAVSSGPTITDTSSFTFFEFPQDQPNPVAGQTNGIADFPQMGVDRSAVYIGAEVLDQNGINVVGTTGFVIRKSDLLAGALTPTSVTAFRNLSTGPAGGGGSTAGPEFPEGVQNQDPAATEGYFIGSDNLLFNQLDIRRVSDPGGTPTISGNLNLSVPETAGPINVPALGSTQPLSALDDRLFEAMIARDPGGQLRLWAAQNFAVDSSGVATSPFDRDALRWYELGGLAGTPSLQQSGTVFDAAASNPAFYFMPSIAASGQGHALIASSAAGVGRHIEIAAAERLAGDPAGTMSSPAILQTSTSAYNNSPPSPQPWGTHSQTVVDPTDNTTFWTFQEYANATNSWGVRVIQIKAPPPAIPSSPGPSAPAGQASVAVPVTGTSVAGSGFFDPGPDTGGPGFGNHIAATVSGGVTVNSITYIDPTHLTLHLNTTGAGLGTKDLMITNPDGQSRSTTDALTIVPAPAGQPTSPASPTAPASPKCKKKKAKKRAVVAKKCKKKRR